MECSKNTHYFFFDTIAKIAVCNKRHFDKLKEDTKGIFELVFEKEK